MRAQECNRGISSLSGLFFTFHPAPSPPEEGEGSVEARGRRRWPPPNRRTPHCGSAEGIPSFFFCLGEARGWSGTRPGVRPDEAKRKTGCRWFSPGRVLQPGTLRPSPKREHGRALFPGRVSDAGALLLSRHNVENAFKKGSVASIPSCFILLLSIPFFRGGSAKQMALNGFGLCWERCIC